MDNEIRKILVIRLSSLGDIILTTPVLRSLKKKYPAAQIDFLVRDEYKVVLKYNPNLESLLIYKRDMPAGDMCEIIIGKNYDLILDLQNNLRSRKFTFKTHAKIFRFKKPSIKKFLLVKLKINNLTPPVPIPERYAASVPGLKLDEKGPEIFIKEKHQIDLGGNENYIGICPGSRHFTKKWPEEYFISLCKKLAENNFKPVLFGGTDDREQCRKIAREVFGAADFSNNNELLQTVSDMKKCRLIICNDSGLMHAASAINVPVIAIFGSTVREFGFAPYKVKNLILENNSLSCRPCSHTGRSTCPRKHFKCMKEITPVQVYDIFESFYSTI